MRKGELTGTPDEAHGDVRPFWVTCSGIVPVASTVTPGHRKPLAGYDRFNHTMFRWVLGDEPQHGRRGRQWRHRPALTRHLRQLCES
jgi:hypothetical protein